MALTLYIDSFSISPYAFSVYVALEEKGVPYVWKTVSLPDKAHHRPEYLGPSMTGRVPAIDHDGFWLAEWAAIVNYLGGVFLPPWGKTEQWLISVQHTDADVDRFLGNVDRFARLVTQR